VPARKGKKLKVDSLSPDRDCRTCTETECIASSICRCRANRELFVFIAMRLSGDSMRCTKFTRIFALTMYTYEGIWLYMCVCRYNDCGGMMVNKPRRIFRRDIQKTKVGQRVWEEEEEKKINKSAMIAATGWIWFFSAARGNAHDCARHLHSSDWVNRILPPPLLVYLIAFVAANEVRDTDELYPRAKS
jgi:hypothetical protein